MFKKIIFPFFKKDRHQFLIDKWQFRLLVILYIISIFSLFIFLIIHYGYVFWGWCYDNNPDVYIDNWDERYEYCAKMREESLIEMWQYILFIILGTHYLVQLLFFKVVVNFIILGGKK